MVDGKGGGRGDCEGGGPGHGAGDIEGDCECGDRDH